MPNGRREFTITKVERDPEHGFWTARVTVAGDDGPSGKPIARKVDRKYGSWQCTLPWGQRTEVLPHIAAALQAKVRRIERAERKEEEVAA